ncbi:MAG: hypothetical protein ACI9TH_001164 [Kiritimatiellia bacterium]|jgi:hypothetical protein
MMKWIVAMCLASLMALPSVFAADEDASASSVPQALPATPLGVRQARVERMMRELERKFTALASALEKTEKEQADRLIKAFHESKKMLIEDRMKEIAGLLDDAKLEKAAVEQEAVLGDLKSLLELLLTEEDELDKVREEIAALEELRQQIADMVKAEQSLLDENRDITDQEKELAALAEQIEKVKDLIKQEEKVVQQSDEAKDQGLDELNKVADEQRDVRKQTESLASEMNNQDSGTKPGAKEMTEAAEKQQQAEQQLGQGKAQDGQKSAEEALAQMKKALEQLEKEQAQVAGMKPEDLNKTAEKQEALAKQMEQMNQQQEQSPASESPAMEDAKQNMDSAQKNMAKAAGKMSDQQGKPAQGDQQKAKEDLEKALAELDDRLDELKKQAPDDAAAALAALFEEMLEEQKKLSLDTRVLDDKKGKDVGRSMRAEKLMAKKLSGEESTLSKKAGSASDIIKADGSSVVFDRVVENMEKDLVQVALWLGDQKTTTITQEVQYEVEMTLQELIEAMKRSQEQQAKNPDANECKGGG